MVFANRQKSTKGPCILVSDYLDASWVSCSEQCAALLMWLPVSLNFTAGLRWSFLLLPAWLFHSLNRCVTWKRTVTRIPALWSYPALVSHLYFFIHSFIQHIFLDCCLALTRKHSMSWGTVGARQINLCAHRIYVLTLMRIHCPVTSSCCLHCLSVTFWELLSWLNVERIRLMRRKGLASLWLQ